MDGWSMSWSRRHLGISLIQSWSSAHDRSCRAVTRLTPPVCVSVCLWSIRLEYLSEDENPPLVHSLSYGDEEPEIFNTSIPGATDYARRIDLEFLKFGLRGKSAVVGGVVVEGRGGEQEVVVLAPPSQQWYSTPLPSHVRFDPGNGQWR